MRTWSLILRIVGFLGIIVGILIAVFDDGGGAGSFFSYGLAALLLGVLMKGLYPISQWAEKNLADAGYEEFQQEEKTK
jgi:hypothetical protein